MKLLLPNKMIWEKNPSMRNALGLDEGFPHIVSIVGAGGKTSIIETLAKEYDLLGKKVIVTTTTHMFQPERWTWCREESLEIVDEYLRKDNVVWIGIPQENNKMKSPNITFLDHLANDLINSKIPMLIEADGSKRLPFKIPNQTEPVILKGTSKVIAVLGLDAYLKPVKEVCFRYEIVIQYLKKSNEDIITEKDFVEVIRNHWGLHKEVTSKMDYRVILNKADNDQRREAGIRIRKMLQQFGIENVYITSLIDNEIE